ncbi:phosphate transport system regulatory protein PhoU [Halobacteriales archaeon QS_8_69_26]|nr:MAG: phosphate transport system regulatory protein PhoU [Halobacteriales archaeon QS_8_69_26]
MPRERYQEELETLRTGVVELGGTVRTQLDDALAALETGDETLARSVVDGDAAVNERYLELEADCIDLFALQQPVASDLRFVAASFKILSDLERVGDLAVNLGQYAVAGRERPYPEVGVGRIGEHAADMVADALTAYRTEDAELCRSVAARDDAVDALCQFAGNRVVRELIAREADGNGPWSVERVIDDVSRVLLTIRDLERVADHAVNVAARTLYLVDGDPELVY